jgi:hypothetical protein
MTRAHTKEPPHVGGWVEWIGLPDFGIRAVRAKLDTGARTSALHVENVRPDGKRVRFDIVLDRNGQKRRRHLEARVVRHTRVRSSNGQYEDRLVISTRVRLGTFEHEAELTLVDRSEMRYRILLGRTGLRGILVDPNHRYLLTRGAR